LLLRALRSHQSWAVQALLEKQGAASPVNKANKAGEAPLFALLSRVSGATAERDAHSLGLLLKAGEKVPSVCRSAMSPLLALCSVRADAFVEAALQALPRHADAPLQWSTVAAVAGRPALALAAEAGNAALARHLIDVEGAAVDARDAAGRTPLMWAATAGRAAAAQALLNRGACASAKDRSGRSVLEHCLSRDVGASVLDVASALLAKGAVPSAVTDAATGEGLLHRAIRHNAVGFIATWAAHGGDLLIKCTHPEVAAAATAAARGQPPPPPARPPAGRPAAAAAVALPAAPAKAALAPLEAPADDAAADADRKPLRMEPPPVVAVPAAAAGSPAAKSPPSSKGGMILAAARSVASGIKAGDVDAVNASLTSAASAALDRAISVEDEFFSNGYRGKPRYLSADTGPLAASAVSRLADEVGARIKRLGEPPAVATATPEAQRRRSMHAWLLTMAPRELRLDADAGSPRRYLLALAKFERGERAVDSTGGTTLELPVAPRMNKTSALVYAVRLGNAGAVRALCGASAALLDSADGWATTPLSYAFLMLARAPASADAAALVDLLLSFKPNADTGLESITSPVLIATVLQDKARLAWMALKCGAHVSKPRCAISFLPLFFNGMLRTAVERCGGFTRVSALHIAAAHRDVELVRLLLALGADPNALALPADGAAKIRAFEAKRARRAAKAAAKAKEPPATGMAKKLEDAGAKLALVKGFVKTIELPGTKPHPYVTPLHIAARMGLPTIAAVLLDNGALPAGVPRVGIAFRKPPLADALTYARRNMRAGNTAAARDNWNSTVAKELDPTQLPPMSDTAKSVNTAGLILVGIRAAVDPTFLLKKLVMLTGKTAVKAVLAARKRPIFHADPALATAHVLMLKRAPLPSAHPEFRVLLKDVVDNGTWGYLSTPGAPASAWRDEALAAVAALKTTAVKEMKAASLPSTYEAARRRFVLGAEQAYLAAASRAGLAAIGAEVEAAQRKQMAALRDEAAERRRRAEEEERVRVRAAALSDRVAASVAARKENQAQGSATLSTFADARFDEGLAASLEAGMSGGGGGGGGGGEAAAAGLGAGAKGFSLEALLVDPVAALGPMALSGLLGAAETAAVNAVTGKGPAPARSPSKAAGRDGGAEDSASVGGAGRLRAVAAPKRGGGGRGGEPSRTGAIVAAAAADVAKQLLIQALVKGAGLISAAAAACCGFASGSTCPLTNSSSSSPPKQNLAALCTTQPQSCAL